MNCEYKWPPCHLDTTLRGVLHGGRFKLKNNHGSFKGKDNQQCGDGSQIFQRTANSGSWNKFQLRITPVVEK